MPQRVVKGRPDIVRRWGRRWYWVSFYRVQDFSDQRFLVVTGERRLATLVTQTLLGCLRKDASISDYKSQKL